MHSIRIFTKYMGDPYYEPTIVVHDTIYGHTEKKPECRLAWRDMSIFSICTVLAMALNKNNNELTSDDN